MEVISKMEKSELLTGFVDSNEKFYQRFDLILERISNEGE